jgi:ArsR family transcriptional regulator, repressor of sdpIR and other operons
MNLVFKALADPTRRRVLELLRSRPMTAGELADGFAFSKPTMSAHFAVLKEAGLVEARRQGKTMVYQLKLSVLEDALLGFAGTFGMVAVAARRAGRKQLAQGKGTTR